MFCSATLAEGQGKDRRLSKKLESRLDKGGVYMTNWKHLGKLRVDSARVISKKKEATIYLSKPYAYIPYRREVVDSLYEMIANNVGRRFRKHKVEIIAGGLHIEDYIPNYYRTAIDTTRIFRQPLAKRPVVRNLSKERYAGGLTNKNVALWHSHGWYYEQKLGRWEWQRPRLFGSVEDVLPMSFMLPYLVPMLENAGANVYLPRERDIQKHEVIVDMDGSVAKSVVEIKGDWMRGGDAGFKRKEVLYAGDNPFKLGTYDVTTSDPTGNTSISYIPDIPEEGEYAVCVSWHHQANMSDKVIYKVNHLGGATSFEVNQKIGGETWIYLGTFKFAFGVQAGIGSVELIAMGDGKELVSADAVRFGGGIGNVARGNKTRVSGKARYEEAARYYLQYAGMPDTLVYSLNGEKNDYNDDYQSRGEWVDYLMGNPNGPVKDREVEGLGIPIDLSFAMHTDAGVTPGDSIIGTLGIYSTAADSGLFPNGVSRMASRDLTDLIQTEVVNDIRLSFNEKWTRRGMWDKLYSEAWRPNVPAMLMELLSHQNLADMRMALDPRFRFVVSRAIYKGMLKFLSVQYDFIPIVQPLPVSHFGIDINKEELKLSWRAVIEAGEATSVPQKYKVYTRIGDGGFDNGVFVNDTIFSFTPKKGETYSFKVTAINDGGESFPSEVLSACIVSNSKGEVLVVNAFDRIAAPRFVDNDDVAGFTWWEDEGVADKYDISRTGNQYDFKRFSKWLDDDSPGWGASYADMESGVVMGNTFDFTITHGKPIVMNGYSYTSVSDEYFNGDEDLDDYFAIDVIMGEERIESDPITKEPMFEVYPQAFRTNIRRYLASGGNIIISGAYIGTAIQESGETALKDFASEVLHYRWRTNHAVRHGDVMVNEDSGLPFKGGLKFNTTSNSRVYKVEAPDAIEPVGRASRTIMRYRENNTSAGVCFNGKGNGVILGFPIETITEGRDELMMAIFNFFEQKH
ncbi:hypothetical protein EYV94_02665 [Puteibacter caeruleilacunae]|nr:hypothetical protein EYV94_02665 [Puteibacter caeruleilacunae]